MGTKFRKLWDSLHSSFWFVLTLMVVLAIGLSFVTIGIDQTLEADLIGSLGWAYTLSLRHANRIDRGSQEGIAEALDRNDIQERYLTAVKAISDS